MDNNSKYPIVRVLWNDASSDENEWKEDHELDDDDEIVTSVGFLVKQTKNFIWLASSTYDRYTNSRTKIPIPMIKEMGTLLEGKT